MSFSKKSLDEYDGEEHQNIFWKHLQNMTCFQTAYLSNFSNRI